MNSRRFFGATLVLAALAGCTSMGNKVATERASLSSVAIGESDRRAIHAKFGQPDDVIVFANKSVWRYIKADSSPEPLSMALGILIWPLALAAQTDFEIKQTDVHFSPDGKVTEVSERSGQRRQGLQNLGSAFSDEKKLTANRIKAEMEALNLPFDEKAASAGLYQLAL
jgi:hypothetical protein